MFLPDDKSQHCNLTILQVRHYFSGRYRNAKQMYILKNRAVRIGDDPIKIKVKH